MAVVRQPISLDQLCKKVLELFKTDGPSATYIGLDSIKLELRDQLNIEASPQEVVDACNTLGDQGLLEVATFRAERRLEEDNYRTLLKLRVKQRREIKSKRR